MTPDAVSSNVATLEAQRAVLLDVLQALAAFGRKRAERRADMSAEMHRPGEDRAGAPPAGVDRG